MSEVAEALASLGKNGNLSPNDKKWITRTLTRSHERDLELEMLRVMRSDPEFKYFMGMSAGAGIAFIGGLLKEMTGPEKEKDKTKADEVADAYGWLLKSGTVVGASPILAALDWSKSSDGLAGQIGNILALGGTGYAGTCAMILILKAIFSGTDLGELLSGMGDMMPL